MFGPSLTTRPFRRPRAVFTAIFAVSACFARLATVHRYRVTGTVVLAVGIIAVAPVVTIASHRHLEEVPSLAVWSIFGGIACAEEREDSGWPKRGPAAGFLSGAPAESVARSTLPAPGDPQDPEDICEAIENGCLKGCKRGAEILERWGLIEEGDMEAYVDDCMVRHCDSPCKPTAAVLMTRNGAFSTAVRAALVAASALACTDMDDSASIGDSDARPPVTTLSPVAGVEVPHSVTRAVSLVNEATACTIDSFDVRVRCVGRDGSTVGLLGREGDGPGEFRGPSRLARGVGGRIGVMDSRLRRFQVFLPTGELVASVAVPVPVWVPRPSFGSAILGTYSEVGDVSMFSSSLVATSVSMSSGEIVEEWRPASTPEAGECGAIRFGFPSKSGAWVFVDCRGRLSFVDGTGRIRTLQSPTWVEELPNERDVADFAASERRMGQSFARIRADMYRQRGRTPPGPGGSVEIDSAALEEYRQRPKSYYLLRGQETIDAQGRLWISTQRDRAEFSYLDIFSLDAQYFGTLRVVGRMVDFDVLGATLIVLVEGAAIAASRRIDWYEIPSDFGASGESRNGRRAGPPVAPN